MNLQKDQIVTCNLTFQARILKVYEEDEMIEFRNMNNNKRVLIPISLFEKIAQVKH